MRPDPTLRQRGVVLVTVMVVMFLSMLFAVTLGNHFAVQEARDIEQLLATLRASWALSGHVDYVLSRASKEHDDPETNDAGDPKRICDVAPPADDVDCENLGGFADDDRQAAVQVLLAELHATQNPTTGESLLKWFYPEPGDTDSIYFFFTKSEVSDVDAATDEGKLRLRISIPAPQSDNIGPLETISNLSVADLWVDFCLVANLAGACPGAGVNFAGDSLISQIRRRDPVEP